MARSCNVGRYLRRNRIALLCLVIDLVFITTVLVIMDKRHFADLTVDCEVVASRREPLYPFGDEETLTLFNCYATFLYIGHVVSTTISKNLTTGETLVGEHMLFDDAAWYDVHFAVGTHHYCYYHYRAKTLTYDIDQDKQSHGNMETILVGLLVLVGLAILFYMWDGERHVQIGSLGSLIRSHTDPADDEMEELEASTDTASFILEVPPQ